MDELAKINGEGTTVMLVTHDVKVAAKCTRVLYIVDGNIKGEYNLEKYTSRFQLRERERALSSWLMEWAVHANNCSVPLSDYREGFQCIV